MALKKFSIFIGLVFILLNPLYLFGNAESNTAGTCDPGYVFFEAKCQNATDLMQNYNQPNNSNSTSSKVKENAKLLLQFLKSNNMNIVTAESLTAGLIVASLVDIPFYGGQVYGGFAVYDTRAKRKYLNVTVEDIYTPECAIQMAQGALNNSEANTSLAVTGHAGPVSLADMEKLGQVDIGVAVSLKSSNQSQVSFETKRVKLCLEGGELTLLYCKKYNEEVKNNAKGYASTEIVTHLRRLLREETTIQALKYSKEFLEKKFPAVTQSQ